MTRIVFKQTDGTETAVDARDGDTVMVTAVASEIDGIVGECGGAMMCATCHCYLDARDAAGPRAQGEEDMLECVEAEVRDTSRLTCQIVVSPALEGVVFEVPAEQF